MQAASTQEWSAKIAAWRRSGMSIAAWCRENSESYYRFLYWRKRVAAPDPGSFLELTLPAAPISLECNGVLVHVSKGFDPGLLDGILLVLKRA
jgi:hypothetical protein